MGEDQPVADAGDDPDIIELELLAAERGELDEQPAAAFAALAAWLKINVPPWLQNHFLSGVQGF
ncbi:hypothetical protein [Streptomyces sp. 11-1-2]|uniref:hypothetical protein n=1 Tax=unclassified Streptomyces TaxID=2593676 RepID=UPI0013C523DD|nr:hypothetical protein [Streptomyces sp. 11-1-2]